MENVFFEKVFELTKTLEVGILIDWIMECVKQIVFSDPSVKSLFVEWIKENAEEEVFREHSYQLLVFTAKMIAERRPPGNVEYEMKEFINIYQELINKE